MYFPGAKWHHTQAVQVVYGKDTALSYPARVHSNTGHWPLDQLALDGQTQGHFSQKTLCAWLSEYPDCPVQFSSSVTFWHAIQQFVSSAEGQMNAFKTHQLLKCDRQMQCLPSSKAADGWRQEAHTQLCGHRWAHVESSLHRLFVSPSCWWGYSKHFLERLRLL